MYGIFHITTHINIWYIYMIFNLGNINVYDFSWLTLRFVLKNLILDTRTWLKFTKVLATFTEIISGTCVLHQHFSVRRLFSVPFVLFLSLVSTSGTRINTLGCFQNKWPHRLLIDNRQILTCYKTNCNIYLRSWKS